MVLSAEERRRIGRQNAQRSTGPRTSAGKSRSSLNATKHGLTATTLALLKQCSAELRERLEVWLDFYKPRSPEERVLVERAAVASAQKYRCITAAHHHLRRMGQEGGATANPGTLDPAPTGPSPHAEATDEHIVSLYQRYGMRHDKNFLRACTTLLRARAEAGDEAQAPAGSAGGAGKPDGEESGGATPYGYY